VAFLGIEPELKAAVLVEHLARNHPLPNGNKRAAFLSVWLFLEVNGRPFAGEDFEIDVRWLSRSPQEKPRPTKLLAGWRGALSPSVDSRISPK
jgi:hypothetical protein